MRRPAIRRRLPVDHAYRVFMNAPPNSAGLKRSSLGLATAGALTTAAALHGAWAAGSTFPVADRTELAELVVGTSKFPSRDAAIAVAGLLSAAAGLVAIDSSTQLSSNRVGRIVRLGTRTVATTLVLRGVGGLLFEVLHLGTATEAFRKWNLRLYSPLCLLLGLGAGLVSRRPRRD